MNIDIKNSLDSLLVICNTIISITENLKLLRVDLILNMRLMEQENQLLQKRLRHSLTMIVIK